MSIAPPAPGRATVRRSYRPARIAGAYLLFGAAWLGLTGARGDGFGPSVGPDAVFLVLSALLVYRLARRTPPADAVAEGTTDADQALDETQRRFREALRVARLGHWSWDEGTGRVRLSDECRAVFGPGATAESLDFEQFLELIHPDDRSAVAGRLAAARAGADRFATDLRVARAEPVRWVHCQAQAVRGADGLLERLDGLVQDITDRTHAAERLRDRERLLAIVTSAAQIGLVVVGDRYEYLFANDAYAEMLGFPPDGIVGRQVWDLLPEGWAQIRPRLERALAGERVSYEIDLPVPGYPGPRTFRVMYEPRPKDGRPTVVVVLVDVTEQKQAVAAIRESEARFRTLVSALPDAVYINSGGRAVYCNPASGCSAPTTRARWSARPRSS